MVSAGKGRAGEEKWERTQRAAGSRLGVLGIGPSVGKVLVAGDHLAADVARDGTATRAGHPARKSRVSEDGSARDPVKSSLVAALLLCESIISERPTIDREDPP